MLTRLYLENRSGHVTAMEQIERHLWGRSLRVLEGLVRRRIFIDIFSASKWQFTQQLQTPIRDELEEEE